MKDFDNFTLSILGFHDTWPMVTWHQIDTLSWFGRRRIVSSTLKTYIIAELGQKTVYFVDLTLGILGFHDPWPMVTWHHMDTLLWFGSRRIVFSTLKNLYIRGIRPKNSVFCRFYLGYPRVPWPLTNGHGTTSWVKLGSLGLLPIDFSSRKTIYYAFSASKSAYLCLIWKPPYCTC